MQKDPEITSQPALTVSNIQLAVNRCTDLHRMCTVSPPVYTRTGMEGNKAANRKTGDMAPHYSALLCSHPVRSLRELDVLYPFIDSETLTDEI